MEKQVKKSYSKLEVVKGTERQIFRLNKRANAEHEAAMYLLNKRHLVSLNTNNLVKILLLRTFIKIPLFLDK